MKIDALADLMSRMRVTYSSVNAHIHNINKNNLITKTYSHTYTYT